MRRRVLFVCVHNSARSQMAEGMLRAWAGEAFEAGSAGLEPTSVRPEAVEVMSELGIDISGHRSTALEGVLGEPWDIVVTVCDPAREACPVVPAAIMLHWSVDDPAAVAGSEAERLDAFRTVRGVLAGRIKAEIIDRA